MRRLNVIFILICLLFLFTGCGWNEIDVNTENSDNRIRLIYNDGLLCRIVVDTKTGVQYLYMGSQGGVCPMYDKDGSLLIWEDKK